MTPPCPPINGTIGVSFVDSVLHDVRIRHRLGSDRSRTTVPPCFSSFRNYEISLDCYKTIVFSFGHHRPFGLPVSLCLRSGLSGLSFETPSTSYNPSDDSILDKLSIHRCYWSSNFSCVETPDTRVLRSR